MVLGLSEFRAAMDKVIAQADAAAKAIVTQGAASIEAAAKANFAGAHKKGQPHVGGDLPNVVTGTLRRSITHTSVVKVGLGTWGTTVGPTTVYGRRVELGFNGSKGYPFFGPAVEKNAKKLQDIAVKAWTAAIRA